MSPTTIVMMLISCADGFATCYVHDVPGEKLYIQACEIEREPWVKNLPGKVMESYEDSLVKFEVIKCIGESV